MTRRGVFAGVGAVALAPILYSPETAIARSGAGRRNQGPLEEQYGASLAAQRSESDSHLF
jgi:hypothetical protein